MTARRYLLSVVMTVMTLVLIACSPSGWAITPTAGHDKPAPAVMTTKSEPRAVMTVQVIALEALHVRAEPGHDKLVIGYLGHDRTVTLTGQCSDGWAQIEWEDGPAWVNASYLSNNSCQTKE